MDSQRPEHEYLAELALLKAALSAAEVARDAYASEVEDLKAELEECKPKPDNAALKQRAKQHAEDIRRREELEAWELEAWVSERRRLEGRNYTRGFLDYIQTNVTKDAEADDLSGSAGEDTPSVWEQSPARPGVQHYTETLAQLPDVQSRLAWLLRGLPKQTKPLEIGVPPALIQEAYDALERLKAELKCWTQGRADLQPVDSDYNNALIGIRWALQDLGLRVKSDPEATKSAVEVLCVQLRKEGRAWTGEMLGGLTCPSQMQKEDNAALKQRVFTALGERLVRGLSLPDGDLSGVAEAIAQFDLLSHSVKGDSK